MYSYALLEPGCYYLIQEKENDALTLLQVKTESDNCMFVIKYKDESVTEWKRKSDPIFDIVECLTDKTVKEWSDAYYSSEDAYYEEDDD